MNAGKLLPAVMSYDRRAVAGASPPPEHQGIEMPPREWLRARCRAQLPRAPPRAALGRCYAAPIPLRRP